MKARVYIPRPVLAFVFLALGAAPVAGEQVVNPKSFVESKLEAYKNGLEALRDRYRKVCTVGGKPFKPGDLDPVGGKDGQGSGPEEYVLRGSGDGYEIYSYEINRVDQTWYGSGPGADIWGSNPYSYRAVERIFGAQSSTTATASTSTVPSTGTTTGPSTGPSTTPPPTGGCLGTWSLGAEGGGSYSAGLVLDPVNRTCQPAGMWSATVGLWVSFMQGSPEYSYGANQASGWRGNSGYKVLGNAAYATLTHTSGRQVSISFYVCDGQLLTVNGITWR